MCASVCPLRILLIFLLSLKMKDMHGHKTTDRDGTCGKIHVM